MTTERVIEHNRKINLYNLHQIQFAETDCTSGTTDMDVSKKLVDNEGKVVMLVEALTKDYYSNGDLNATKGCFTKRFEFAKETVNSRPWFDFIVSFMTSVRYRMVLANNQKYLAYYSHIWLPKYEKEQCVIAELLNMKAVHEKDGIVKNTARATYAISVSPSHT
ncbi:MAG: hypothetical protein ACI30K_03400 [Muribaculaceae bacterium]